MRLFDRYIFEEITAPFIIGVLIILVMLLGDQLYQLLRLVITKGVGLVTVGRLLLFMLPEMTVTAFPLATVLAVSMGLGRLVRDNEWSSMRLAGSSLGRLLAPIALFGVTVAGLSWLVGEKLAPQALAQFNRLRTELALADPTVVIEPQRWFRPGSSRAYFYVNSLDDRTGEISGVIVFHDTRTDFPTALFARSGRFRNERFYLQDVIRQVWRPDGTLYTEAHADQVIFPVERLSPKLAGQSPSADEMTAAQLRELIDENVAKGVSRVDQVLDLQLRYAAPVSCLILALLCVPLNLLTAHRGSFVGLLITATMAIVYFLMMQFGESLARTGVLQDLPALGAWLHNIVFAIATAALLWKCR